jgi:integrase
MRNAIDLTICADMLRHMHLVPAHQLKSFQKVLLRHSNLSTTQRYLGKISDAEAIRWIDNLHG